jgi:hypothetical protein
MSSPQEQSTIEETSTNAKRLMKLARRGGIAILAAWVAFGLALFWYKERGTFGDMFGALNALFSGLAFLGVILAIVLQYEELKEQRQEIRQSRIAHEATAKSLEAQLRNAELRSRIESLNLLLVTQARILDRINQTRAVEDANRRNAIAKQVKYLEEKLQLALEQEIHRHE